MSIPLHLLTSNIAKAFTIHFSFDKAFIEPCMRAVLRQVDSYAKAHSDEKLVIIGHTDKTGSMDYNQSLSERRARSTFAYLTFGQDAEAAVSEWTELRLRNASGKLPSIHDNWSVTQYQYMLQDLEFYRGNIDGIHGTLTNYAVSAFRCKMGLPQGTVMDDPTWEALIREYLKQDNIKIPDSQFLPNANEKGCNGGILKWLGCGEESPTRKWGSPPKDIAWRPYRRVELLFIKARAVPCDVPQPDTFNSPSGNAGSEWCLGPKKSGSPHCGLITYEEPKEGDKRWFVLPVERKTIVAGGTMSLQGFPPRTAVQFKYILTVPDGEYVDGEKSSGEPQGKSVSGVTDDQGSFEYSFSYPGKPEGVYSLEIKGNYVMKLADQPPKAATRSVICKQLSDSITSFDVIIIARPPLVVTPAISPASSVVVMKKPYTNPARQKITLSIDYPFCQGEGVFTRSSDMVRFFTKAEGGDEILFNGVDNVFSGPQLMDGVTLFAQGSKPSAAMDEVELLLTLVSNSQSSGAPAGQPARATMTAVELVLDICGRRTAPGFDPAPLSADAKIDPGRPLKVKTPANRQERAMLIVRPPTPARFDGELVLSSINDQVKVFSEEVPSKGQTPLPDPFIIKSSTIPADGIKLWAQGEIASKAERDSGLLLGIKDLETVGDKVVVTVLPYICIRLIDDLDHAITNAKYRLEIAGQTLKGTTDSNGILVEHILINIKIGKLVLVDKLFHQRDPQTGVISEEVWSMDIEIAELDGAEKVSGAQARLNNLGLFATKQISGNLDDQTKRALSRFQGRYSLPVTGSLDDKTQDMLKKKYGS